MYDIDNEIKDIATDEIIQTDTEDNPSMDEL
jgi:hypothetical protein